MAAPRPTSRPPERVLVHNSEHGIATLGAVLVQVRRGAMTLELLESIASFTRASRVLHRGPLAMLSVLEEGAPLLDSEVRKRQTEIIQSLMGDPNARTALVNSGQSTLDSMRRASVRMTSQLHSSQVRIFSELGLAIDWLREVTDVDATVLRALVDRLRRPPG